MAACRLRCPRERGTGAGWGSAGAAGHKGWAGGAARGSVARLPSTALRCLPFARVRRHHLGEAVAALQAYEAAQGQLEVAAEELRAAARTLGRVTGAIDTEQVLDEIFSEFCIGK